MDLHVTLGPGPKRAQLERRLRDAVRSGTLKPGTRLPPTRTLARDLGVSRGVVVEAYEQLVAEGWLTARPGAGTTVTTPPGPEFGTTPGDFGNTPGDFGNTPGPGPKYGNTPGPAPKYDLRTGRPDLSAFPRGAWLAALGRVLKELPDAALGYGDRRGHLPLREALAAYLGRVRGVVAEADRIVVCGGLAPGLTIVVRALARRHGPMRVAVEDPGWRGQRRAADLGGVAWVPAPVDEHGLVVDALPDDARAVFVTPAHQFPTGAVLAPERRAALVRWARDHDALIVEDDYDAEYRYDRDPVGALQGLAPDRVLYAGSASKTLAPALRLGWLVAPDWFARDLAREKDLADRGTPVLEQAAYADLLGRGEIDRHLRRTRRRYRDRRDTLVHALGTHLPSVRIGGAAAGLHVVAWLDEDLDEERVAAEALARGVVVERLGLHLAPGTVAPPALVLGYALHPEPVLERAAAALAEAVAASR